MGGIGSGDWTRYGPTKRRVESCLDLDMTFLLRRGWLSASNARSGVLTWTRGDGSVSKISMTTDLIDADCPVARLSYTVDKKPIEYSIQLARTFPHFGGVTWWFLCPLTVGGVTCERQIRKLYLSGQYFGCRHCHKLTYKSCQEHDARLSRLMKNPGLMNAMIESEDMGTSLLALKAATRLILRNERRGI
jgi:hypothetical protein